MDTDDADKVIDYKKIQSSLFVIFAFVIFLFLFPMGIIAILAPSLLLLYGQLKNNSVIRSYGIYLFVFYIINLFISQITQGLINYLSSTFLSIFAFLAICKIEKEELRDIPKFKLNYTEFLSILGLALMFGLLFFALREPVGFEIKSLYVVVLVALFSSVMEEVWFRYYLQKEGFMLQGLVFAMMHLGKVISLPVFALLIVFALIAGRIKVKNGLIAGILFHFITNFILFGLYLEAQIALIFESLMSYVLQERVFYILLIQLSFYGLFRSMILYHKSRKNTYLVLVTILLLATTYFWTGAFGSKLEAFIDKYRYLLLLVPVVLFLLYNYLDIKRLEELKEKEKIRNMFSKYVNPTVVNKLVEQSELKLDGKRQEVSVLFCDIRGFTSLSEKIPPEKVVEMLNIYYKIVTEVVFKYNGTVDKFVGDAVMVIFNAPLEQKNHYLDAVMAGVEIQKGIWEYNKNVREEESKINVGVGINTGEAVVGNVGTLEVMNYTVIGDPVNTAARMQSLSKTGEITITEGVYKKIKGKIKFKIIPAGKIEVKGKEKPLKVYKVVY